MHTWWHRFNEWSKYERLHHYPELRRYPKDVALRLLQTWEKEERAACNPWLGVAHFLIVLWFVMWVAMNYTIGPRVNVFMGALYVPQGIVMFVMHRRLRRRVAAKVAADAAGGRLRSCIECGYDLRASPGERCPECGALIVVRTFTTQIPPANGATR